MENTVELVLNHYIDNNFSPSRQVTFVIPQNCLEEYLQETEDDRSIEQFLDSYDSNEADVVYAYAGDDGRILSSEVTYCEDFEEKYKDFINRMQIKYSDKTTEQIATKENYYWSIYFVTRYKNEEKRNMVIR